MGLLYEYAVQLLLEDRVDEATDAIVAEGIEDELLQQIRSTSELDYLLKLDQFFDERNLYMYDGWENAQILKQPKVDKFWVTLDVRVPKETELKGARRCCAGKENQNTVEFKQLEDGSFFIRFHILRRILDKLEMDNRDRANDISDKESAV
jgi:hypothetical protein